MQPDPIPAPALPDELAELAIPRPSVALPPKRLPKATSLWVPLWVILLVLLGLATRHYREVQDRRRAEATVRSQLAAMRKSEWARAYDFASQELRDTGSADDFRGMVLRSYRKLVYARSSRVRVVRSRGKSADVRVHVIDEEGLPAVFNYALTREGGDWRVEWVSQVGVPVRRFRDPRWRQYELPIVVAPGRPWRLGQVPPAQMSPYEPPGTKTGPAPTQSRAGARPPRSAPGMPEHPERMRWLRDGD